MKVIIGLTGVKTSGKSTVANMIKNILQNKSTELALANKLKDVCSQTFGIPRNYFDDPRLKEVQLEDGPISLDLGHIAYILSEFNVDITLKDFTKKYIRLVDTPLESARRATQIVGTEILRSTGDQDIHCKNLCLGDSDIIVVSDIRFLNEFNYFNNLPDFDFIPIYIQRDKAEQQVNNDSHISEKSVFDFNDKCFKITNNGTLNDLNDNVLKMLEQKNILN